MRKKIVILIVILFNIFFVYSENSINFDEWYECEDGFRAIHFYQNNKINFRDFSFDQQYELWNQSYKYSAESSKGIYKFKLDNGKELIGLVSQKYLVLYERGESKPIFIGGVGISAEATYPLGQIEATSFLTENGKEYKSSNLDNLNSDSPWVEGVKGYGIGEKLIFQTNMPWIVFFSGYFSLNNPSLYEKNSRVKKVKFKCLENGKEEIWNFEDTAGGQQIDLSNLFKYDGSAGVHIEMEILEVYKGTKYADTCINGMYTAFSRE
jgi:hypothetical protein